MSVIDLKTLYETDDYLWLESTIELLKNKQFKALDLENLIEELEDLGSEKKHAVVSFLNQLLRHLLLLQYWTSESENNSVHWQEEIYNFRSELNERLTTTLRNYLEKELERIYQKALKAVKIKTQNSVEFPSECPYTIDELLDENWLPGKETK
ncbi:DUF29 domain-containing protein [Aerosakkonemataceae cyanobacterium BLCC-F154]|uniref:DUF29 domain-containing protein n=1 Tax=Floridaenema fluviatile BLCC-F154 TaxID=3153640 RepID=A0ABV4YIW5_9CYAN